MFFEGREWMGRASLLVFALTLLAASLVVARHISASKPTALLVPVKEPKHPGESHYTNASEEKRGLLLRIGRGGFEPPALTIRQGEYFVVVLNSSHLKSMSIAFHREGAELVGQYALTRETTRWSFKTRLLPGSYLVTSSARPDWVCRIAVTAN